MKLTKKQKQQKQKQKKLRIEKVDGMYWLIDCGIRVPDSSDGSAAEDALFDYDHFLRVRGGPWRPVLHRAKTLSMAKRQKRIWEKKRYP